MGAHRGASIIAEQLSGNSSIHFKGYLGNNIVKFFDYTLASVGIKPNELKNFDYDMVEVNKELMQDITQEIHHYIYVFILKRLEKTYTQQQLVNKVPIKE